MKASNPDPADNFGDAVSISGDIAVVGAPSEAGPSSGVNGNQFANGKSESGAAYVFTRTGGSWVQEAYLKASNSRSGDDFGSSVAASGSTVVVGSPGEDSNSVGVDGVQNGLGASRSGAVYVFVKEGADWVQQAFIKAPNTDEFDGFGASVALAGDTLVVGAFSEDSAASTINGNATDNSSPGAGAAYVYVRSGTTWSFQAYLKASNCGAGDGFGSVVAISGDTVLVSALQEASNARGVNGDQLNNSLSGAGAVYVFTRSGASWTQQAYLKASNSGGLDYFGSAIAISGDTAVIGANYEDSNAAGVNGNQANDSLSSSGAAYVFVRTGSAWSQQAYLKASNPGVGDYFGAAVAISGDTIAVGAQGESSNARGIGGNQSNNDANDAGAAYLFSRTNGKWTVGSYLKASNTRTTDSFGDFFGCAVALSGSTLLVGAFEEDGGSAGVNGDQFDRSLSSSGAVYVFAGIGVIAPEIVVEQPAGNGLISGGAPLVFGSAVVGDARPALPVVIRNTGNAPLTGISFVIDGPGAADFSLDTKSIGTSLLPDSSATFGITFTPSDEGSRAATLHIASNDPDENPFDMPLIGTGNPGLAFQAALTFVNEEAGTAQIPVLRKGGTSGAVSVVVNSAPGTATATDFAPVVNVTVNFADGQALATVPVTITADSLIETNETFTLNLSNPQVGIGLGSLAATTVRIVDLVDTTKPTVTITAPIANASINEGAPAIVSGAGTDGKGIAKVQFSLNGAVFTDAAITLNAKGTSAIYTAALAPLRPGSNTVAVKSIDTRGNESTVVTRTFNSIVKRPLVVNKTGTGTLTAPFPGTDATKQVGFVYTLKATPGTGQVFNGWTVNDATGTGITAAMQELPTLIYTHQEGLVLTANFIANPFTAAIIGKFNGLAQPSATVPPSGTVPSKETVGGFTAAVTSTGSFTGTLKIDGLSLPVNGIFDNAGVARFGTTRATSIQLARAGKPPLEVALALDMTGATGVLSGTVRVKSRTGAIVALSDIVADRAAYSLASKASSSIAGTASKAYTIAFRHQAPPFGWTTAEVPQGDGYATGTIKMDGTVSFTGKLADNTAISVSTALSKTNTWPWFSQLYSLGGTFAALVAVDTSAADSDLTASGVRWFRPWQNVQWYPWGWVEGIGAEVIGATYAPPALASLLPVDANNGNATLQWSDGLLVSSITKNINIHPTTSAVTKAPATDTSYTVILTAATGLISGTFTHANGTKPAWQGVLIQKGTNKGGYGYYMTVAPRVIDGLGESGALKLLPR